MLWRILCLVWWCKSVRRKTAHQEGYWWAFRFACNNYDANHSQTSALHSWYMYPKCIKVWAKTEQNWRSSFFALPSVPLLIISTPTDALFASISRSTGPFCSPLLRWVPSTCPQIVLAFDGHRIRTAKVDFFAELVFGKSCLYESENSYRPSFNIFRWRFLHQFWYVFDDPALFRKVFTHSIKCCNAFCDCMCDAKVSDEKQLIRRANECIIVSLATTTVPNLPKLLH